MPSKGLVATVVGNISWTPPVWIVRIGGGVSRTHGGPAPHRRCGLAVFVYVAALPEPLRVASTSHPGLSRIRLMRGDPGLSGVSIPLHRVCRRRGRLRRCPPRASTRGRRVTRGRNCNRRTPGPGASPPRTGLVFEAVEDWRQGRGIRVLLSTSSICARGRTRGQHRGFETPAFVASVTSALFYQHPEIVAERRITASISFSHPVSRPDLEERLTLSIREGSEDAAHQSRPLPFRVEYGPHDRTAHVLSDVVRIPEREQFATVAVAAGLKPVSSDAAFEDALYAQIKVPDRSSYFRVESIAASIVEDAKGDPVQTAVVAFTDQVDTEAFGRGVNAWLLPRDRKIGNTRTRVMLRFAQANHATCLQSSRWTSW